MPADPARRIAPSCRKRLFVIEHDEVCGATLQLLLSADNEVQELNGISQALEYGINQPPDAILLDVAVLINGGREVLDDLRSAWPGVKTMVVCGTADQDEVEACLALGADGALARPISMDNVRFAMGKLFGSLKIRKPTLAA